MTNSLPKHSAENEFLTGVVEGFYGRPWTYPQRKELFRRMNHMGMNAYLYAPKDDIKHRQSWRDLYVPEEEQQLRSLITESTEAGVLFIFALSPGLDVTFSSAKEVDILKKKLDQVSKLGCRAFALLFDDIEARLCPADREVFSSSARAQVAFANDIYNHLGCPSVFLFCPTEYCASLALPSIMKSEYLSTIASCLHPDIAVIWTGPLVVSKKIFTTDVQELSTLLQHPIVLWDNLHANDYDQRRVFIGPYSGRPVDLRRKGLLRGVLTNPNCEFEANYVALHTLAQWSRRGELKLMDKEMSVEIGTDNETGRIRESSEEGMVNDLNDENTGGASSEDESTRKPGSTSLSYRPREALLVALRDWLSLMLQDQQVTQGSFSKPATAGGSPTPMETDAVDPLPSAEAEMQVDSSVHASMPSIAKVPSEAGNSDVSTSVDVTIEDLELFADLFYLPFAHGPAAVRLLELGHWLREHSYACGPNPSDPEKNEEWRKKFSQFAEMVSLIARLRDRIQRLPSRSIAYELTPYVTEVHTVLGMVLDYFRWLETGVMACRSMCHLRRLLTWFSPGYRDMVTSGDQEPWTFRGGLITELQRILPLESAQDLFPAPSRAVPGMTTIPTVSWPEMAPMNGNFPPSNIPFLPIQTPISRSPRSHVYVVRPYRPDDKASVYALFRRLLLARVGLPETALPVNLVDLPGDRYLLHFLEHSPENCLVVEGPPFIVHANGSDEEVRCVGFGFSASNAVSLARDRTARYKDALRLRYPLPPSAGDETTDRSMAQTDLNVTTPKLPHRLSNADSSSSVDCALGPSSVKPPMSVEELIKFLVRPFHADSTEVADIANVAAVLPPPEPLGAALPTEPALSGCLVTSETELGRRESLAITPNIIAPVPSPSFPNMECASSVPPATFPPQLTTVLPTSIIPDTAPPSPPSAVGLLQSVGPTTDSRSSSPATQMPTFVRPVLVAGGPEALHTALAAHPATLWVEFDDLGVATFTAGPTPAMLINHNLGLSTDPPELVLDSVARRLFVCLLAALKTVGAHGSHVQLDAVNEQRAELYRRFGFYPVPSASTEQSTILARLI
ncbi:hypothetical protein P879_01335 [Paragonimus westermani]|uniref:protein O-GlcNAcase n=1 Tax=Paragonimus westermani TaxID=34504 RepID=A0A8T0D233_9TREM|nr:hypothetical protein P879_01335 [Paragonimus westermani]